MAVDVALLGNVLIIGGTGFVGRHCINNVLETGGSDVRVYTLNRSIPQDKRIPNITYLATDLGDAAAVDDAVRQAQPKVVLHFASPRPFIEQDEVYERTNIRGTRNLLKSCQVLGTVKAFVYCSSVSIVTDGSEDVVHADESWPVLFAPEQKEYYWHSKAVAERLVLEANDFSTMRTTALRVTSIFGEDDEQVIGGMLSMAKTGGHKVQFDNGKNRNNWTYVGTVVEAHIHAARCLLRGQEGVGGEAFFITNDEARPFWGFVRQVAAAAGYPVSESDVQVLPAFMAWVIGYVSEWVVFLQSFGSRKATTNRRVMKFTTCEQIFSMEKAKRVMGFVPNVGIDEAVARSVEWFQSQGRA